MDDAALFFAVGESNGRILFEAAWSTPCEGDEWLLLAFLYEKKLGCHSQNCDKKTVKPVLKKHRSMARTDWMPCISGMTFCL
jgi:hypothetical protein